MIGLPLNRNAGIAGSVKSGLPLDPSNVEILTTICARELVEAFGLDTSGNAGGLLFPLARRMAYSVAHDAAAYDHIVGESGLRAGGRWAISRIAGGAEVRGEDNIPQEGPLLIVSNHPGLSDTVALFSAIEREDLRIIAAKRDFLDALPNTADHLFTLDTEGGPTEFGLIRNASRHMKRGGTLLTFPGGRIEPDPAIYGEAAARFTGWSESFGLFARLVPDLTIVPALVSGVISRRAMRNPVSFVRSDVEKRRWLAATLQMISPALHPTKVRVDFGRPVLTSGLEKSELTDAVIGEMRRLVLHV